jgi:rod shape-determining protein MreC
MQRRGSLLRTAIAVVLVALIVLALYWLGWLRPIFSAVTWVLEPVARGGRVVVQRVGNSINLLGRIADLDQENKRVSEELQKVQTENARLKDQQQELEDLRERLDAPLAPELETFVAGVIGHDAISGTKSITINRGERDGVVVGAAVLSSGGVLVGRVEQVLASQAQVTLLTDDRSAIPSRISESRATGITRGELGLGLKMTDIPQQETVNVGDTVVTSGLGDELPKGLVIGRVETVETAANALFQVARVRPVVEVTRLEFVHIVRRQ